MAKQRSSSKSDAEPGKAAGRTATARGASKSAAPWPPWARWLASGLLLLHVVAVFAAPWANQTSPRVLPPDYAPRVAPEVLRPADPPREEDFRSPPLIGALMSLLRPYLNATYTNHGYDFFTPDPAGSYLIGYDVYDAQGQIVTQGQYPDLDDQWPRLFYHRHMMLAAQIDEFGLNWPNMIGRELLERHNAERVHLLFGYHRLPLPEEVAEGTALNARWLYETVREFDIRAGDRDFSASSPGDRVPIRVPGVTP